MNKPFPIPMLASAILLALPGLAQRTKLYQKFDGSAPDENYAASIDAAGDVNGDGIADYVVGAPDYDDGFVDRGLVEVRSGLDHSVLMQLEGDGQDFRFGKAVSGLDDINGDGYADFLVGASGDDTHGADSGWMGVVSGEPGAGVLWFMRGNAGDLLGFALDSIGDVDNDGISDVVVGAHKAAHSSSGKTTGQAYVLSGVDGSLILTLEKGNSNGLNFGISVAGTGDVDADGTPDIVVGANQTNGGVGSVWVFSGADGSVIHKVDGLLPGEGFGREVSGIGDVDGDGHAEFVVAERKWGSDAGRVVVYQGRVTASYRGFEGSGQDRLGRSIAPAGDVDGDGRPDLMIGASNDNRSSDPGYAAVYSVVTGELICRLDGSASEGIGSAVAALGDLNGDGTLTFGAGADDENAEAGALYVFEQHGPWNYIEFAPTREVSITAGGTVDIELDFPVTSADRYYHVLFSLAGTGPIRIFGLEIPLSEDAYFLDALLGRYPNLMSDMQGRLDANGDSTATVTIPANSLPAALAGKTVWFAAVEGKSGEVSEAEGLGFVQ